MKKNPIALIAFIVTTVLVTGCQKPADSPAAPQAALTPQVVTETPASTIAVSPAGFNFGDIRMQDGPVTTLFTLKNTGAETLILHRLSTSCGCTTASMDMTDFAPNETRIMTVTYDPTVHPDQFGPIQRVVYLQTSDPVLPEIQIDLTGNVLP